jgi:polar amino acid transport system substrate-binding protein
MALILPGRALLPLTPIVAVLAAGLAPGSALAQTDPLSIASDGRVLPVLKGGWYLYEPCQFMEGSGTLTGIDIRVAQAMAQRLGYFVDYRYTAWTDQIAGIRDGSVDFTSGATPTAAPI